MFFIEYALHIAALSALPLLAHSRRWQDGKVHGHDTFLHGIGPLIGRLKTRATGVSRQSAFDISSSEELVVVIRYALRTSATPRACSKRMHVWCIMQVA